MPDLVELHAFARTLERLGVEPPAGFAHARSLLTLGVDTAQANPVDALLADFQTGALTQRKFPDRLRAAALEVAAKDAAYAVLRDLTPPLVRHAARAVRDDGDRLIAELRRRFDQAKASMITAGRLFGENTGPEQVLALGGEAAAAWQQMSTDADTLDAVLAARMDLARWGYGTAPQRSLMFVSGIGTAAALAAAEQAFSRPAGPGRHWHALTAAGFGLHLATAEEVVATQARLRDGAEQQAEAHRRRQADSWRSLRPAQFRALPHRGRHRARRRMTGGNGRASTSPRRATGDRPRPWSEGRRARNFLARTDPPALGRSRLTPARRITQSHTCGWRAVGSAPGAQRTSRGAGRASRR